MRRLLVLMFCAACTGNTAPVPDGVTHVTGLANNHVTSCTDQAACGGNEPPVGGPHCGSWLPCRVHTTAQSRCQYVHNLEHGHMVLAYNCPSGCDDVQAALAGYQQSHTRVLLTPDPRLSSKVAAMVWGYSWAGDTVDVAKLDAVRSMQDVDAPEAGLGCAP
ncbi:MAG: DUF3105 domain-containing protein [Myxococcaceae bacterium]|nr:DUF3105 domain-containing protein [Myxococcaceae bacterium]